MIFGERDEGHLRLEARPVIVSRWLHRLATLGHLVLGRRLSKATT